MENFGISNINVCKEIDPQDGMLAGNELHYFSVGQSALKNILIALSSINIQPVSILDLPCGHGRVLRYIAAQFPESKITACDLDRQGVDFCAKTFAAKGIYSKKDIQTLNLGETYDLIWCGSLLTHIDQYAFNEWLHFFSRHLKQHGVVLFTTHGRTTFNQMKSGYNYSIDPADINSCLKNYKEVGYGYANYPNSSDYGISLSSPCWVIERIDTFPELHIISFAERAWDNHQDVFVVQKIVTFDETTPFDEAFYLNNNPDVMSAVKSGLFCSGYEHYRQCGFLEKRAATP